ncbi:MAG: PEP-CTERM sorting domain-containing protein [Phycisphaerales bacterium]
MCEVSATLPQKKASVEWSNYVKAAGMGAFAIGLGNTADAAIISNGGTYNAGVPTFDIVIDPISYTGANVFDLDNDGVQDVRLGAGGYNTAFADSGDTSAGSVFTASGDAFAYATAFAPSALIDGSAVEAGFFYGAQVLNSGTFAAGGYLGVQTSQGYFGWMELLVESGAVGGNTRITVKGWAYDDTGAAIAAGDSGVPAIPGDINGDGFVGIADLNIVLGNWNLGTPPATGTPSIPEPGSLMLLAAGAVGVAARRRKING